METFKSSPGISAHSPLTQELIPISEEGWGTHRMAFVIAAPGCVHARSTGGCHFCGFQHLTTGGRQVLPEEYHSQAEAIRRAIESADGTVVEVDLYNSGSFLADKEIPPTARVALVEMAAAESVQRILIESRPEFVTVERLAPLKEAAGVRKLRVGIGLESCEERVREGLMNKGIPLHLFERAAVAIRDSGAELLTYVLVKPPGLGEEEAFRDAYATVCYLRDLKERLSLPGKPLEVSAALQPAFVAEGTKLEEAYLEGRYELANLWTVVDLVRHAAPILPIQVGLWDEGLSQGRVPTSCPECQGRLRESLRRFNRQSNPEVLEELTCACRPAPFAP